MQVNSIKSVQGIKYQNNIAAQNQSGISDQSISSYSYDYNLTKNYAITSPNFKQNSVDKTTNISIEAVKEPLEKSIIKSLPENIKVIETTGIKAFMETRYPYVSNSAKDDCTAHFTTMLLILFTPAFHSEHSYATNSSYVLEFNPNEKDKISTVNQGYKKQQELFRTLYLTNISTTLNDMKEIYTEIAEERFQKKELTEAERNRQINIINSVTEKDIKEHLKRYLIGKKPVIYVNSEADMI